jgi:TM2 domain-containing membrane protein YozV
MDTDKQLLIEMRVTNDAKSPFVAYLLLILLWGFGVHRMYLSRWISGLIMLAIWGVGWLTTPILIGWVPVAFVALWCVIDLFLIPGMIASDKADIRRRVAASWP